MHISRIKLKNIRGFKELDFDLAHGVDEHGQAKYAGWIVFTGGNGAGKSTLLKAIAAGLVRGQYALTLEPKIDAWVRHGEKEAHASLSFVRNLEDDFFEQNKEYPQEVAPVMDYFLPVRDVSLSNSATESMDAIVDSLDKKDNSSLENFAKNFGVYLLQALTIPDWTSIDVTTFYEKSRSYLRAKSMVANFDDVEIEFHELKATLNQVKENIAKLSETERNALEEEFATLIQSSLEGRMLISTMLSAMMAGDGLLSENSQGWFSCGYGPFRRVFGASQEATQLMTGEVVERFATLFQEAASLYEADRWLRDLKYKTLEGNESAKAQLEIVLELLRDEFMPNQITLKDVNSDGLWLEDRNGLRLAWRDMSDGYRAALALLSDILRQLIRKFGVEGLAARNAEGRLYITRSGVVLIDEVDAHLHPEWQREISGWLKRHFPHIQFLVTTHSPLICQAADKIFVLPEPGSDELPYALSDAQLQEVRASKSDAVLRSPAFGLQNTRSELAVENLAEFTKLRSKQRAGATLTAAESTRLAELDNFIHADKEL
ncbi:MAG: AAA family ATPase [Gallionella sp.]|nr:AAA family ATPase [Gallionella sp.]MDD4957866.1 AAA family ATPase [Gallionella sp.]